MIMADLKESMEAPPTDHRRAYACDRVPLRISARSGPDEPGADWIMDAQAERACLRASETAVVIANYIRLLGFDAKAHTGTSSDVDLNRLTVAAGLASVEAAGWSIPMSASRFGVAA
jgi:hypothetical protein